MALLEAAGEVLETLGKEFWLKEPSWREIVGLVVQGHQEGTNRLVWRGRMIV